MLVRLIKIVLIPETKDKNMDTSRETISKLLQYTNCHIPGA